MLELILLEMREERGIVLMRSLLVLLGGGGRVPLSTEQQRATPPFRSLNVRNESLENLDYGDYTRSI